MDKNCDGDQVGLKMCYSIEANAEAKKISESVKNFVGQDGSLIRTMSKEAYLTFYNLTRNNPVGKRLPDDKKNKLLKIPPEELTLRLMTKLFGYSTNSSSKDKKSAFDVKAPEFNLRDTLTLEAGEFTNKTKIETNVGKLIFNKIMLEGTDLVNIIPNGYYNVEVTASNMKKFTSMIADGCMRGDIKVIPTLADFLKKYEFWGLTLVTVVSPSYSIETIIPNKQLEKRKKELLAQARKGNVGDLTKVENELVSEAKKLLAGTPGMYMFESGARGSFDNDYKNMQLAIGAVENPITGETDFMTSNYMTGIKKEDLIGASNIIVNAEYPKAINTATGGYMGKQFFSVFQSLIIDKPGTDCGAMKGLSVTLTKDNLNKYLDQYIIDGHKLILITEKLDSSYMNHPVEIRSPMYCLGEKFCSKCAGERYYKLEIENIGLGTNRLSGSLQNASLKARHNLKINVDLIDEKSILI